MGVLPLAVAARPCLCQTAFGRLSTGSAGFWRPDLSCQEAVIRREGEMAGAAGPIVCMIDSVMHTWQQFA